MPLITNRPINSRFFLYLASASFICGCNPAEKNIENYYKKNYLNESYSFKSAECVDTLWSNDGDTILGYGYVHEFKVSSVTSSGQWSPITFLRAQRRDTVNLNLSFEVINTRENSERGGSLFN